MSPVLEKIKLAIAKIEERERNDPYLLVKKHVKKLSSTCSKTLGEKVTFIAQRAPGATVVPQVEFKSNGRLRLVEEIASAAVPVFVRVTV